jgi:hypothetical protein
VLLGEDGSDQADDGRAVGEFGLQGVDDAVELGVH